MKAFTSIAASIAKSFPVGAGEASCRPAVEAPLLRVPFPTPTAESASPFILHDAVPLPTARAVARDSIGGLSSDGRIAWFASENELVLWDIHQPQSSAVMTTSHLTSRVLAVDSVVCHHVVCDREEQRVVVVGTSAGVEVFTCDIGTREIFAVATCKKGAAVRSVHCLAASQRAVVVLQDGSTSIAELSIRRDAISVSFPSEVLLRKSMKWVASLVSEVPKAIASSVDELRNAVYVLCRKGDSHWVTVWAMDSQGPLRERHSVEIVAPAKKVVPIAIHTAARLDDFCFVILHSNGCRTCHAVDGPMWVLNHQGTFKVKTKSEPHASGLEMSDSTVSCYHDGSWVIFDGSNMALTAIAQTVPCAAGLGTTHDVVSTVSFADRVLAVATIASDAPGKTYFALLSRGGVACIVERQSEHDVVVRHCRNENHRIIADVIENLEPQAAADLLLKAVTTSDPVAMPILAAIYDPLGDAGWDSLHNKVFLSPSACALKRMIDCAFGPMWNARLSTITSRQMNQIEMGTAALHEVQRVIALAFEEPGLLTYQHTVEVVSATDTEITVAPRGSRNQALDAQAQYLRVLASGLERALTVVRVLIMILDIDLANTSSVPSATLAESVWGDNADVVLTDMCSVIARRNRDSYAQLLPIQDKLPAVSRAELRIRRLRDEAPDELLVAATEDALLFYDHGVLGLIVEIVRSATRAAFIDLQLMCACIRSRPTDDRLTAELLSQVASLSRRDYKAASELIFQLLPRSYEHHAMVLDWMIEATADDESHLNAMAHLFAVASTPHLKRYAASLQTSNDRHCFFLAAYEQEQGEVYTAAQRFFDLAMAPVQPLRLRSTCIFRARAALPSISDDIEAAVRSITAQEKLLTIVTEAAKLVEDPQQLETVQHDAEILQFNYLGLVQLFAMAKQYEQFCGAEVELEILRDENEVDEMLSVQAVQAFLANPRDPAASATDVCHELLHKYHRAFVTPFPLHYVISFLHARYPRNNLLPAEVLINDENVAPQEVFETYLRLLEQPEMPTDPDFRATPAELLDAMASILYMAKDSMPGEPTYIPSDQFKKYVAFTELRVKRLLAAHQTGTQPLTHDEVDLLTEMRERFSSDEMVANSSIALQTGTTTVF